MAFTDADGKPFTGANRYVIRFAKGGLPSVSAFWSITLYDTTGFIIQLRHVGGHQLRSDRSFGSRNQLGADRSRRWLEHHHLPIRTVAAVVR
jgi:Protein of unknown function (DUF1214)